MMDIVRTTTLMVLGFAGGGCSTNGVDVAQYGEMRQVLRDGQTGPRIELTEAVRNPHAYGIGALENLDGEITIIGGRVWVARASGNELRMSGPGVIASDRATLMTLSHVPQWTNVELTEALGGTDLETAVEELARAQGIDTSKPFLFVVNGNITQLELHVIAGSCPVSGISGAVEPWRLSLEEPVEATLVGFFASGKGGIMTHHGSFVHMHVVMPWKGRTITAHIDHVVMDAGSILRLPKP